MRPLSTLLCTGQEYERLIQVMYSLNFPIGRQDPEAQQLTNSFLKATVLNRIPPCPPGFG